MENVIPVARVARAPVRVFCLGRLITDLALHQYGVIQPRMALGRRDKANGTVSMILVIPTHKLTNSPTQPLASYCCAQAKT